MKTTLLIITLTTLSAVMPRTADAQADSVRPTKWNLQVCIDYALSQNIAIRKSRITAEGNETDLRTARAAWLPNLTLSASQSLVNRPYRSGGSSVNGNEIISADGRVSYSGNYGLNSEWTLYNGGRRMKTIRREELNTRVARLNVAAAENEVREAIAKIYVQILYATEAVRVNEGTLAVATAQRDRAQQLLAAGSIARSDLAQLEAQVSNDRYQLVTARSAVSDYRLQLKQLLELDGEEEMVLDLPALSDADVLAPLPSKAAVFEAALAARPEIEAARLNVEAARLGVGIARANGLPTLRLSAGIGTMHYSGSNFTFAEQVKNGWNNSIGLNLSLPILNNRQTKSAVEKARQQHDASRLDLTDRQKTLYKTIETLWLDATNACERYAAAAEKLKSSQASFALVSEQFAMGMKNTVELLTEKNNLLQAEEALLQAKYTAILNRQLLKYYQGEPLTL